MATVAADDHRTTALELTALGSLGTLLATELGTHGTTALELAALGTLRTLMTAELGTHGTTALELTALGSLRTLLTTELGTHGTTTLGLTSLRTMGLAMAHAGFAVTHTGFAVTHTGLLAGELCTVSLHEVSLSGVSLLGADLAVLVGVILSKERSLGVNRGSRSSYRSGSRCRSGGRSCLLSEQRHGCYESEDDGFVHNRVFF